MYNQVFISVLKCVNLQLKCKFALTEMNELIKKFGDLETIWKADKSTLLETTESIGLARQIAEIF